MNFKFLDKIQGPFLLKQPFLMVPRPRPEMYEKSGTTEGGGTPNLLLQQEYANTGGKILE
jgi:hypothetical protein